jgi:hypothetical protein
MSDLTPESLAELERRTHYLDLAPWQVAALTRGASLLVVAMPEAIDHGEPAIAVCRCAADGTYIAWWKNPAFVSGKEEWQRITDECYPNGGGFECPYRPGDVLACREPAWYRAEDGLHVFDDGSFTLHKDCMMGAKHIVPDSDPDWGRDRAQMESYGFIRQEASELPDWAIRLRPTIASIAPLDTQAITEEQALAAGMHEFKLPGGSVWGFDPHGTPGTMAMATAREALNAVLNRDNCPRWAWGVTIERSKG